MTKKYTIVAAIDFSELSDAVITRAFDVAERHKDSIVHFVTVVTHRGPAFLHRTTDPHGEIEEATAELHDLVNEAQSAFEGLEGRVHVHGRAGNPAMEIAGVAAEAGADLVVVGRHGWNASLPFFVGSVPQRLLRLVRCSVLVVQPTDYEVEEIHETCHPCAAIREKSAGERWFCEHHRRGSRIKRVVGGSLRAQIRGGVDWGA